MYVQIDPSSIYSFKNSSKQAFLSLIESNIDEYFSLYRNADRDHDPAGRRDRPFHNSNEGRHTYSRLVGADHRDYFFSRFSEMPAYWSEEDCKQLTIIWTSIDYFVGTTCSCLLLLFLLLLGKLTYVVRP